MLTLTGTGHLTRDVELRHRGRPGAPPAGETVISPDGAAVSVLVIPTDEELEMATQAAALVPLNGA